MNTSQKIKDITKLALILTTLKEQSKKIVTTNGVFDILHRGHITYLQEARKKGDVLVVGLNSDASVKRIKGDTRPLNNQKDRAHCLAALECVDYVVVFEEENPIQLLDVVKPNIHVKGGDYKGKEHSMVEKEVVESHNGEIVLVDFVEGYSTTDMINRMKKN